MFCAQSLSQTGYIITMVKFYMSPHLSVSQNSCSWDTLWTEVVVNEHLLTEDTDLLSECVTVSPWRPLP